MNSWILLRTAKRLCRISTLLGDRKLCPLSAFHATNARHLGVSYVSSWALWHEVRLFASKLGVCPFLFRSKSSKSSDTSLSDYFLLLSMQVDDENNIIFCKRAFSNVLEGVLLKIFSIGKPTDPILQWGVYENTVK